MAKLLIVSLRKREGVGAASHELRGIRRLSHNRGPLVRAERREPVQTGAAVAAARPLCVRRAVPPRLSLG